MRNPIMQITMKDIFLLLTLFALGNAIAAPPNKPGVQDLAQAGTLLRISLPNPSFEEGTQKPNKWTPMTNYVGDQYLWDNSVTHAGRRSIAISGTRYQYGLWESDPIDVMKAGFSFYSLTGHLKTIANNGYVYLSIAWFDRDDNLITTSDSLQLPFGNTDWHLVTVNGLPPDGTVNVRVWCQSNHNDGTTWFDELKLTVTQFTTKRVATYDQFLIEFPGHPLALAAHTMRVKALMTKARWIREEGYGNPDAQKKASQLYAQAASIIRNDAVLAQAAAAAGKLLAKEQAQFEALIDKALWEATITDPDTAQVRLYLQQIILRNNNTSLTATATQLLSEINQNNRTTQTDSKGEPK